MITLCLFVLKLSNYVILNKYKKSWLYVYISLKEKSCFIYKKKLKLKETIFYKVFKYHKFIVNSSPLTWTVCLGSTVITKSRPIGANSLTITNGLDQLTLDCDWFSVRATRLW